MNKKALTWVVLLLGSLLLASCSNLQPEVAGEAPLDSQRRGIEEVKPLVPANYPYKDGMVDETTNLWFVEFSGPPTVKGGSPAALRNQRANFRSAAAAEGIVYRQRLDFERLFNGLSVEASASEIGKIARLGNVVAVYPVVTIDAPKPEVTSLPDMRFALEMTGARAAQQAPMGLTGKGVRVAVIDSGIDYLHPDLGRGFGPGKRVAYGYDFVGDDFDARVSGSTPVPDPDPMDCGGHGTHVAGIVGANGNPDAGGVRGVAPEATLGAYRVFGCEGSTTADIIIQALEMAHKDGMHIVNMSLGAAYQWPQYPSAVASDRLVDAGVVVVASIGNSGATGIYSAGAPGVGEKVIGVASFDNTHIAQNVFEVSGRQIGYSIMTGSVDAPESGSADVVWVGRACNTDGLLTDPRGKTALAVRGVCPFAEKAKNAIDAGASAVIIYNNAPGTFAGTLGDYRSNVPVVSISQADGQYIQGLAPVSMTWRDIQGIFPNPTGNLISSFSSYGLTPDLKLKPDLGAPGGLIYSTYPRAQGSYATLSGTSMSSPHVAGAVALFFQARPNTPADMVRSIFQNNAVPQLWSGNPGLGYLDSVHRQGAGMINIPKTINATTSVTPAKLALGALEPGRSFSTTLTLRNNGGDSVTYSLSNNDDTIATGRNTYTPSFAISAADVTFSSTSVTVPARSSAAVTVTIANPFWPTSYIYGGYLEFTASDGEVALRVPYSGFGGNYQAIQVLTPTQFGFPWLAKLQDGSYRRQTEDGTRFTMNKGDTAFVLAHFEHQSRLVKMEIVPLRQVGGARDLTVFESEYFGRNGEPNGFFAFEWDGSAKVNGRRTPLPMGDYKLKLSVLKALGNADNPAHWETWTSPVITIARN